MSEDEKIQQEYIESVAPAMVALMEANIAFAKKYPATSAGDKVAEIEEQLKEWQDIVDGNHPNQQEQEEGEDG